MAWETCSLCPQWRNPDYGETYGYISARSVHCQRRLRRDDPWLADCGLAVQSGAPATIASVDPSYLQLLHWRMVGPSRGGRVVAVAGDPVNKQVFYFGATGGGIWKTDDGGIGWHNVSDGFVNTGSVGALAVAPSNSNIVYAGMGEACVRGDASYGDGVYKSTDAGKTWTHVGLEATRSIARVRIHPKNPDLVYVAALGDPWGPSADRGVFRSKDGGRSWQKILFRNPQSGASISSWTPRIPTCSMRPLSNCNVSLGLTQRRSGYRHCSKPPMAATPGRS